MAQLITAYSRSLWALLPTIKDGRWYQILFLSSFLLFGLIYLTWDLESQRILITFSACLATQSLAILLLKLSWHSIKSALITSLSLTLLFKSHNPEVIIVAAVLAIASKFIIRFRGKHIFNPANFGIISVLLLTDQAWIAPGQWGNGIAFLIMTVFAGAIVLKKVGRLEVGVFFLLAYGVCQFIYLCIFLNWPVDYFFHTITNGTLLIFAFFMITDPMTSPNHPRARMIWAAMVGIGAFILQQKLFIQGAALWVLFFACPLNLCFDYLFKHQKFNWLK